MESSMDKLHSTHFMRPEEHISRYLPTKHDQLFLDTLKLSLKQSSGSHFDGQTVEELYSKTSFPQQFSRLILVLYAPGHRRVVVTRPFSNGKWSISRIFKRLVDHARTPLLVRGRFYLQFDFVVSDPKETDLFQLDMNQSGERHFEMGIDGLLFNGPDHKTHVFVPGDAYVRSILGMKQLRDYLYAVHGEAYISRASFQRFRSDSYLLTGDSCLSLYRGRPVVGALTKTGIERAISLAVGNITRHQSEFGSYLYYYDVAKDSRLDPEHPTRHPENNPYYNVLRHSGGGLTCLWYEAQFKAGKTFDSVCGAIEYLKSQTRYQDYSGREGAYIYSEQKAKLGASGLALYLVSLYQKESGDERYRDYADKLAWHLLNQITEDGEFLNYHIYLDEPVSTNKNIGSSSSLSMQHAFHYPGQALCGLASYLHIIPEIQQCLYIEKLEPVLDRLISNRERDYLDFPDTVMADNWLMMAINELWAFKPFQKNTYSSFVFDEAEKLVGQMYRVTNAPYPDYAGAFYYQYGDFPYPDGARLEALLAAYELAEKLNKKELMRLLWHALRLGAWAVMHLVNTPEAIYSAYRPDMALGGIRLRYTRQWYRIDTIQHVAGFYAKLLQHWDTAEGNS